MADARPSDSANASRCARTEVFGSVTVAGKGFAFSKPFAHMESVRKGDEICFDGVAPCRADRDCSVVMPMPHRTDFSKLVGEEACFL